MKKIALVFGIAFVLGTPALAVEIAISTNAGWWPQAAADQEMQDIVNNVTAVPVQVFTITDLSALADWVVAHTGDGVPDLLIMCGKFPDTIYPAGNAQPEGSLAELFLDDGNTIINTGDYIFYVGTSANNDAGGLQNMMDIPAIAMWGDEALPCVPTAEGQQLTPSLQTIPSTRPFFFAQLEGDWYPELILAQTADGARGDPVIVRNSATGGRLGIFYQVADVLTDLRGEVISEWINNWYLPMLSRSTNPVPADNATDVHRDAVLSWTPGQNAATHDVYFGTTFADVNEASRANPGSVLVSQGQTATQFDPAGLVYGQTYYWRVDEVGAAPDNAIVKGLTWSFTAEPFSYPVTPIAATASSAQPGMGPENTINGSGLNANDEHSTELTQMWTTTGEQPNWIQYEFDAVYKLDQLWVWNSNQLIETMLGFGAKNVTIEYSLDGQTWTALEGVPEFAQATATPTYTANTTVDFGGVQAQFVKLTINSNWGGLAPQVGLSEVRFFYIPVQAREPQPVDDATDVSIDAVLEWRPGHEAGSHEVYFGADEAAVADGTAPVETVTEPSFTPAALDLGTTYFWKVNEVNETGAYEGEVWSFTTEDYVTVDDFEGYDNADNRIYETWIDGLTDQDKGGSQVGYDAAPFAERTIVHGGRQSLPLVYRNTNGATFSEATRVFDAPQDWTRAGITTLILWFQGAEGNAGQLYLKINDTKVPYDGAAGGLTLAGWQSWSIDLASLSLNPTNVSSLTIGVEGNGASGTLYFDDIALYASAPAPITEWRVSASTDDAEEDVNGGAMDLGSSDLELVYEEGTTQQIVGCRWLDIPIPQGATITEAWVQFSADDVDNAYHSVDVSVVIEGELSPSPATFGSTAGDISSRPKTTAKVAWDIPVWTTVHAKGPEERTPDISSIIQEIVNQPDWRGGAIVLTFRGNPDKPSQGTREAEALNGSADEAPLLHISYQ